MTALTAEQILNTESRELKTLWNPENLNSLVDTYYQHSENAKVKQTLEKSFQESATPESLQNLIRGQEENLRLKKFLAEPSNHKVVKDKLAKKPTFSAKEERQFSSFLYLPGKEREITSFVNARLKYLKNELTEKEARTYTQQLFKINNFAKKALIAASVATKYDPLNSIGQQALNLLKKAVNKLLLLLGVSRYAVVDKEFKSEIKEALNPKHEAFEITPEQNNLTTRAAEPAIHEAEKRKFTSQPPTPEVLGPAEDLDEEALLAALLDTAQPPTPKAPDAAEDLDEEALLAALPDTLFEGRPNSSTPQRELTPFSNGSPVFPLPENGRLPSPIPEANSSRDFSFCNNRFITLFSGTPTAAEDLDLDDPEIAAISGEADRSSSEGVRNSTSYTLIADLAASDLRLTEASDLSLTPAEDLSEDLVRQNLGDSTSPR